ncbi:MAG TPA: MFS transporter [Noviherbaspirillum sp.]|nr:MFS transporter [Noviherbaspirillum sp.]
MHDDARKADASPPLPPRLSSDKRGGRPLFHPGELRRVALAFSAFFLILCAYYILRPVRDEMAVQYGAHRLQWLFSATFIFTLAVVPAFGWVVRKMPRAYVLPVLYGFLVLNLVGFHFLFAYASGPRSAAAFFVWLSVFNLFVVSLFWSTLGDCFSTAESHRLYGYVAAGGTAGALAGPAITATLARHVDSASLLLLSAVLLALAAAFVVALRRCKLVDGQAHVRPLGGSIVAGIPLTARVKDLRGITLLVLCYTTVSTVLYIELVNQVGQAFSTSGERTRFFASVDLAVNTVALTLQLLGTRKLVGHFGLRVALSAVPALMIAGLSALTALTTLRGAIAFASVQTLHRAGEYALGKPGREMIYTTVDVESRYKAKNFIDTAVYRAGDAASSWVIAAVRGAGLDAVALVGLPVALLWLVTGFRLGGRHDRNEST